MTRRPPLTAWLASIGLSVVIHLVVVILSMVWMYPSFDLPEFEMVAVEGVPWAPPPPQKASPRVEPPPPSEPAETAPPPEPRPVKLSQPPATADLVESDLAKRRSAPPPPEPPAETLEEPAVPEEATAEAPEDDRPSFVMELPESMASGELEGVVDGATVALLLRTENVSGSPQALTIRRAIRAVPGFDLYMGGSAFDPLTDFRWMSVRTPNLRSLTQTLMVAELAVEQDRARATIDRMAPRGERMQWTEGEGYDVATPPAASPARLRSLSWGTVDGTDLLAIGPSRWVREAVAAPEQLTGAPLPALNEVVLGGQPPDLVIAGDGIPFTMRWGTREFQGPSTLVVAARFDDPSPVAIRAWFESTEEAARFAEAIEDQISAIGQHPFARLVDLPGIVSTLEIELEGAMISASLSLSASQTDRVLRLATMLLGGDGRPARASVDTN